MRPLTPVAPDFAFRSNVRLPRDYYVRVFFNDYSVDPGAIEQIVNVKADLEKVTVSADGRLLASHERRLVCRSGVRRRSAESGGYCRADPPYVRGVAGCPAGPGGGPRRPLRIRV
ncbi:Mu transposase domain-containing protein [Pseudarthrobacter oxydans]|uniref:Mu transposase domain-containing protein n=1 Tax=Pseudarthrobacter oxydans TaxID=1671 RepID=UPI003F4E5F69